MAGPDGRNPGTGTPPQAKDLSGADPLVNAAVDLFFGTDHPPLVLPEGVEFAMELVFTHNGLPYLKISGLHSEPQDQSLTIHTSGLQGIQIAGNEAGVDVRLTPGMREDIEGELALATASRALRERGLRPLPLLKIATNAEVKQPRVISAEQRQMAQRLMGHFEKNGLLDGLPRTDVYGRTWRFTQYEITTQDHIIELLKGETDETYLVGSFPTPLAIFGVDSNGCMFLRDKTAEDRHQRIGDDWKSIAVHINRIRSSLRSLNQGEPTSSGR